jgi:hypothetical protein
LRARHASSCGACASSCPLLGRAGDRVDRARHDLRQERVVVGRGEAAPARLGLPHRHHHAAAALVLGFRQARRVEIVHRAQRKPARVVLRLLLARLTQRSADPAIALDHHALLLHRLDSPSNHDVTRALPDRDVTDGPASTTHVTNTH